MKKEHWFRHGYGAGSRDGLIALINAEGAKGLGIYWYLTELLYERGGHVAESELPMVARVLKTCTKVVERVARNYKLFQCENSEIFSQKICSDLENDNRLRDKWKEAKRRAVSHKIPSGFHVESTENPREIHEESAKKEEKRSVFTPPTVEEVKAYCEERGNGIDARTWFDFYQAKGWKIGTSRMKDWKAAVRTWEVRNRDRKPAEGGRVDDIWGR